MIEKRNNISNIPIKKSYGIILCRINYITNCPETLLIHKRYTYAYSAFVHGKYYKNNKYIKDYNQYILNLLNQMTIEELITIWSLNFNQMWYKIWLNNYDTEIYKRKNNKFYMSFINSDGGKNLRSIIEKITVHNSLLWEVPKGRQINMNESCMECAIREVKEETGLDKSNYIFIPNVKRYVNYISSGTRYICKYYIAMIKPEIKYFNNISLKNINNMGEMNEVKWFNMNNIKLIDNPKKKQLEILIKPAFVLFKKYINQ